MPLKRSYHWQIISWQNPGRGCGIWGPAESKRADTEAEKRVGSQAKGRKNTQKFVPAVFKQSVWTWQGHVGSFRRGETRKETEEILEPYPVSGKPRLGGTGKWHGEGVASAAEGEHRRKADTEKEGESRESDAKKGSSETVNNWLQNLAITRPPPSIPKRRSHHAAKTQLSGCFLSPSLPHSFSSHSSPSLPPPFSSTSSSFLLTNLVLLRDSTANANGLKRSQQIYLIFPWLI